MERAGPLTTVPIVIIYAKKKAPRTSTANVPGFNATVIHATDIVAVARAPIQL
jgi:hypothetical protein